MWWSRVYTYLHSPTGKVLNSASRGAYELVFYRRAVSGLNYGLERMDRRLTFQVPIVSYLGSRVVILGSFRFAFL